MEIKEVLRSFVAQIIQQMESTRITPLFMVLFVCMIGLIVLSCIVSAKKDTRSSQIISTVMSIMSAVLLVALFGMKFAGLDRVPI